MVLSSIYLLTGAADSALFVVRTRQVVHLSTLPGGAKCSACHQAPSSGLPLHSQPASHGRFLVQLVVPREC